MSRQDFTMQPFPRLASPSQPPRSGTEASLSPSPSTPLSSSASTPDLATPRSGAMTGATTPAHTPQQGWGGFPKMPGSPALLALDARLARIITKYNHTEARVGHAPGLQHMSSTASEESDTQTGYESEISLSAETEGVIRTGVTTPGPDVQQEQRRDAVGDSHKNGRSIDMEELLKTSNRLLDDGKLLLATGRRRPRQSRGSVEKLGGHLEGPGNQQGWYSHGR